MAFVIRTEGEALAALELQEAQAAEKGPGVYEKFAEKSSKDAVVEAKQLGVASEPVGDVAASSSSDSGTDSGDSDSGSDNSDDSGDFDMGDFGDEPNTDEEEEESEEPEEEEEEETPEEEEETEAELKKESFRSLSLISDEGQKLKQESFFQLAGGVTGASTSVISAITAGLATVAINFIPSLLLGMFKVVLFTFAKTFSLLNDFFEFASETYTRYQTRTTKQVEELKGLKEALKEVKAKGLVLPEGVEKKIDIRFLVKELNTDILKNVEGHTDFLHSKISKLNQAMFGDIERLKTIAENRYLGKSFDALSEMEITPSKFGFTTEFGNVPSSDVHLVECGMGPMIGDVELRGKFAVGRYDTWDMVEKAYNNCSVYSIPLAYRGVYDTPLMTPEQLEMFINHLELLAEASLKHQQFYDQITKSRAGTINSIKQLFVRLSKESVKVSFKNSVALPLHLKSAFITKVYMVAGMDIHDHTAQVIANGLGYVKEMMSLYTENTK